MSSTVWSEQKNLWNQLKYFWLMLPIWCHLKTLSGHKMEILDRNNLLSTLKTTSSLYITFHSNYFVALLFDSMIPNSKTFGPTEKPTFLPIYNVTTMSWRTFSGLPSCCDRGHGRQSDLHQTHLGYSAFSQQKHLSIKLSLIINKQKPNNPIIIFLHVIQQIPIWKKYLTSTPPYK